MQRVVGAAQGDFQGHELDRAAKPFLGWPCKLVCALMGVPAVDDHQLGDENLVVHDLETSVQPDTARLRERPAHLSLGASAHRRRIPN